MRINCFSDQEKLLKFKDRGQEITKILFYSNNLFMQSIQFWKQNIFLTCSWNFFGSDKLETLNYNRKKMLGFRNLQEKLENYISDYQAKFQFRQ